MNARGGKKSDVDRYNYRVAWSTDDAVFVARVAEWPSLGAHADTMEGALNELRKVVNHCVEDLTANGEPQPGH